MNQQSKESDPKKVMLGLMLLFLLCISVLLLVNVCRREAPVPMPEKEEPKVRVSGEPTKVVLRSSLAGSWYSADAETLSKQIEGFFRKANVESIDDVVALILPHAGYQFSGQAAVFALKAIGKKYKRIVVIGPSHRAYMEEVLSVPRVTHYETPLGEVPLDVEFINKLLQYPLFQNVPNTHKYEHSVQIELPLLQYCQKEFKFVPIVAGQCSLKTVREAGHILKSLIDNETLVVASSDFVHYGPSYGYVPFKKDIPRQIKKLDMGAYEYIAALDCKGFLEYKQRTGATICGCIPVAILLSMLEDSPGETVKAELVKYTTSGELTGDFSNSVSYLSVAFSGKWSSFPRVEPQHSNPGLTEEEKEQLLTLARQTIVYVLGNRKVPQPSELSVVLSDKMKAPCAVFVTLKKNSRLRGCIGDIFPRQPLYRSVIANAVNASVNDNRFRPVTEEELDEITIEISVLSVPKPVASPKDIRIGRDGVILSKDGYSAVFLPQVAPEQGWDVNQMLTQLSLKAGLPADGWKEGAGFLVFQAVVFGEEE